MNFILVKLFRPLPWSGVLQGSVLEPLLLDTFIKDLYDVIIQPNCLPFAEDLKVYVAINLPGDLLKILST
jgi:hypothetical protein